MKQHIGFTVGSDFAKGDIIKCVNDCNFAIIGSIDANGWPVLKMLNNNPELTPGMSLPIKCRCGADAIMAGETAKQVDPEPEDAPKKRRGRPRKGEIAQQSVTPSEG